MALFTKNRSDAAPPDLVTDYTPSGRAARAGEWIFQRRTILPLFVLPFLVFGNRESNSATFAAAGALFVLGEGLRLWAVSYARRITRTRSRRLESLVTEGPFAHVRNPIYLANTLHAVGTTLLFGKAGLAPWIGAFAFFYYSAVIAFEEELLRHKFGGEYERYAAAVPRWLPRLTPCPCGGGREADFREALFSERGTFGTHALLWAAAVALHCLG